MSVDCPSQALCIRRLEMLQGLEVMLIVLLSTRQPREPNLEALSAGVWNAFERAAGLECGVNH